VIRYIRGTLEMERDHDATALAALEAGELLVRRIAGQHRFAGRNRALLVHALVRLGQTERAWQFLAGLGEQDRERGEIRIAAAALQLAQGDPRAALAALAPVQELLVAEDYWGLWRSRADVLEAMARDALGDPDAAGAALERALDLSERSGDLTPFLLYPASGLLERHARRRTAHPALIADILSLLAGRTPAPPPAGPRPPLEPLSDSEIRVLRYLPTNLSASQIGSELYVSHNTVRTHIRHVYAKLGMHTRAEAVASARALGLLAPSPLRGQATRPG
jgi:LuxR family transcriptional regulator, maltose regulon positive regulatory protein